MKKILIYLYENELKPTGGANGYNYTLKHGLDSLENGNYTFEYLRGGKLYASATNKINSSSTKLGKVLKVVKSLINKGALMYGFSHKSSIDFEKYDAIHFHRTSDLYSVKDSLKHYTGKVLLTLHAPTMPSKQMFSMLTDFEKKYMKWFYKKLKYIDNFALERADNIIVACEEAEEPYFHEWDNYDIFHNKYKEKYLYMTTGTEAKEKRMSSLEVREKYGLPQDAFVISYVGRHNEIKGYDNLKKIANLFLKNHSDVYFLIAGTEGPLYRLDNERWIEVGWTNDPGSIIAASDLFILPNKETYFDLIFLEVLSLGQIIIATYTGGNRYFERYKDAGIFYYSNVYEGVQKLEDVYSMDKAALQKLRDKNLTLYKEYFTNTAFAKRYILTLDKVFRDV